MVSIKFNYLYRDGSNYKSWGKVVFRNPEQLALDEIEALELVKVFMPG